MRVTMQIQAVDKWGRIDKSIRPVWLLGLAAVQHVRDSIIDSPVHEIHWRADEGQYYRMTIVDPDEGESR